MYNSRSSQEEPVSSKFPFNSPNASDRQENHAVLKAFTMQCASLVGNLRRKIKAGFFHRSQHIKWFARTIEDIFGCLLRKLRVHSCDRLPQSSVIKASWFSVQIETEAIRMNQHAESTCSLRKKLTQHI